MNATSSTAMKEEHRIRMIRHLNTAHQETLGDFIKAFGGKDAAPGSCEVKNIGETGLQIHYLPASGARKRANLWVDFVALSVTTAEVRRAIEELRVRAMRELGLPPYPVKQYQFDNAQCVTLIAGLYILWICLSPISLTPLDTWARAFVPAEHRYTLIIALSLMRGTEYFMLLRPLLTKHRVSLSLWKLWGTAHLFCGYTTIQAFRRMAARTTAFDRRKVS